jgi:hypothetical protein
VRVLRHLPDQRLPVTVRHPIPRFDLLVGGDERVEGRLPRVPTLGGNPQLALGVGDLVEQTGRGSLAALARMIALARLVARVRLVALTRLTRLVRQVGLLPGIEVVSVHTNSVTAIREPGKKL